MFGRHYPPANVRSAAWYLAGVALMAVPIYFLVTSTTVDPGLDLIHAAPDLHLLIPAAIGLFGAAVLMYAGFRFMYPIILVVLVAFGGQAFLAQRDLLQVLAPAPALLLLLSPSALSWFLGRAKHVGVVEREFHLPQR